MPSYRERFLNDPTDTAAASAYFEDLRALAHIALMDESTDSSAYWEFSR